MVGGDPDADKENEDGNDGQSSQKEELSGEIGDVFFGHL